MDKPEDPMSGVKAFSIGGRMVEIRERCKGMTEDERRWRAQFLKDQILDADEPRFVPEYYKSTVNPFRRLWHTPMQKFEDFCVKKMGKSWGVGVRQYVGKTFIMLGFLYVATYYVKYHGNDWSNAKGPEWIRSRPRMLPGDPGYPNFHQPTLKEYGDLGFESSPLCKKA